MEGKIVVFKRNKKDIVDDMNKQEPPIPEKYLSLVKLYECTAEEVKASYDEITKYQTQYIETEKLTPSELWLEKLNALETYLKKNKF